MRSRVASRQGPTSVAPAVAPAKRFTTPELQHSTQAMMTMKLGADTINPLSLLFDPDWYCAAYPDVEAASLDPVRHYFDNGAQEGRDPNAFFRTDWYISRYPDVAASAMNPFLHYLLYGAREGRKPAP